eukprot:Em1412g1a
MALEGPRWHCWRSGLKLVWNHVEILKIVPVDCPLPGHKYHRMISGRGIQEMELPKGIEIRVCVVPEECIVQRNWRTEGRHVSVATWLLQKGVECVRSVLDDWYEVFGKKRGIEYSVLNTASPCPACLRVTTMEDSTNKPLYFFSSPYCALVVAERRSLECPLHGKLSVGDIAPDL